MAVIINRKFCKGCGICVAFCPKQVLELDELGKVVDKNAEACISCGQLNCCRRVPRPRIR